jgi:heme-degrading monooxygenase HmoA
VFAYILRARGVDVNQADEFFRRFKDTPGLSHAYSLQSVDDPEDGGVVAIWDSREAADRYLRESQLRQEVDRSMPNVTRNMYEVRDSK